MIKYIIIIILLFFFSHRTIKKNLYRFNDFKTGISKNFYLKYNALFWFTFLVSTILLFNEKYVLLYGFVGLCILLSVYMNFQMFNEYKNFIYNFYFWLLYAVSCLVAISILLTSYYVFTTHNIKRKRGPRGYTGIRGEKGKESEDLSDIDLCHQQLIVEATNVYNDYVDKYS